MKNKKLFRACMAGMLSAALLMTSVPAMAAEFGDDAAGEGITVPVETQEDELFTTEEADTEIAAKGASEVAINSTNFPDSNFRSYVLDNLDTNKSKGLSSTEIKAVTEIDVSGKGIKNLKGIERFTSLKELYASNNKLTSIDLTKNTKLTYVNVSKNSLKTLDLSKCTGGLTYVICSNNSLTKLTLPSVSYLKKLNYIDVSHNKFTSQGNAGLTTISKSKLADLDQIDASYNSMTSFNCSGFEGILDLSNNKITTLSGGSEGYQAAAIYLEGSGNTLSKTSKVDFATLGNKVPQRFSCNSSVKSKIVMVTPRLTAKADSNYTKITVAVGSTSDNASYKLERKVGSGAYTTVKTWGEGELDDPEFGDDGYVDTDVAAGKSYTYKLTATVSVQNRNQTPTSWSSTKSVTVKTIPGTPSITVKSSAKKTASISWKAVSGASGYVVCIGTSKSKVTTKIGTTTKVSVTKKGLTSGKTYYFRVRAYRTVNGKKVYGSSSSIKSVKVK
ncbi:MAG: leucine-rich repeat domain-containing protein [Eubacteriales bacterium]|nr:leucine-rich repeat domain-containing protein [Eubacteriales bacterium]